MDIQVDAGYVSGHPGGYIYHAGMMRLTQYRHSITLSSQHLLNAPDTN